MRKVRSSQQRFAVSGLGGDCQQRFVVCEERGRGISRGLWLVRRVMGGQYRSVVSGWKGEGGSRQKFVVSEDGEGKSAEVCGQ